MSYPSIYRGVVVSAAEYKTPPHRLQVAVPKITAAEGVWALPCFPAPKSAGLPRAPLVGEGVWIAFENGNLSYPVYLGFFGARDTTSSGQ